MTSKIMIVGEAIGFNTGLSGQELDRMLGSAGINSTDCIYTYISHERPPSNDITSYLPKAKKDVTSAHLKYRGRFVAKQIMDGVNQLQKTIANVQPNIIIALGNVPMWVLTGRWGLTDWRGSMLYTDSPAKIQVIPTYSPAFVFKTWSVRWITVNDLRRAARYKLSRWSLPAYQFTTGTSYEPILSFLDGIIARLLGGERIKLSFDIETDRGHITCAGIAVSRTKAICIPFADGERPQGYWSTEHETEIIYRLYRVLTHSNADVIGQNILYDAQYTWKHWHFVPRVIRDTMISWHSCYSDVKKSLDFQASILCPYYQYWKREGKEYLGKQVGAETDWYYNCLDCCYTYEIDDYEQQLILQLNLSKVAAFQNSMFYPVLAAMQQGILINQKRRNELVMEVTDAVAKREAFLTDVLGHPLNPDSPKQMQALFYGDLKLPIQLKRGKKGVPGKPTLDDDALNKLASKEPLVRPLVNSILDCRTLGKFLSNFLLRSLSEDGRMRCSYRIGGSESGKTAPKTYRLASSEDAFGAGTNLQNIPSEKSKSIGKATARGSISFLGDPYSFPNIRDIFIPDPGYTWFDMDLERADLFVVVYEAEDNDLKTAMHMGVDMHLLNAFILQNQEPPPYEELIETHPRYPDHRGRHKTTREFAKIFIHGTNYTGQPRTMAIHTGRTIAEVERAQRIWFGAHPGIRRWHERVSYQVQKYRFVENRFGYRWYIFDRIDSILAEAVAWIPQSTVAIVINRIWQNIFNNLLDVQALMQVHDSLCGQFRTMSGVEHVLSLVRDCSNITIPYDDPLIIPIHIKTSEVSWGDC